MAASLASAVALAANARAAREAVEIEAQRAGERDLEAKSAVDVLKTRLAESDATAESLKERTADANRRTDVARDALRRARASVTVRRPEDEGWSPSASSSETEAPTTTMHPEGEWSSPSLSPSSPSSSSSTPSGKEGIGADADPLGYDGGDAPSSVGDALSSGDWAPRTVESEPSLVALAAAERELSASLDLLDALAEERRDLDARRTTLSDSLESAVLALTEADEMVGAAMRRTERAVAAELAADEAVARAERELARCDELRSTVEAADGDASPDALPPRPETPSATGPRPRPEDEADAAAAAALAAAAERAAEKVMGGAPGDAEGAPSSTKSTGAAKQQRKQSSRFMAAGFFSGASNPEPLDETQRAAVRGAAKLIGAGVLLLVLLAFVVPGAPGPSPADAVAASAVATATLEHAAEAASGAVSARLGRLAVALSAPARAVAVAVRTTMESLLPGLAAGAADHGAGAAAAHGGGMGDLLVLLATAIVTVPLVTRLPGASPVLGFLLGGALIGPHALGGVSEIAAIQHVGELGVVFLLFHIGLELSLERLMAMGKAVFGMGSLQVAASALGIAAVCPLVTGGALTGSAAVVVGLSLGLSSTAVALQTLQDRGEAGGRHGRAVFSVLLFQDLAVVAVLMLIPLLAPRADGGAASLAAIGSALAGAVARAAVCIAAVIGGGRLLVRPLYGLVAATRNAELFAATTLLMCLGTAELTQAFGLSLALGAFLAGLLLAETEYHLQVEADIAPYRGLLLGLFFMTVGMEISPTLLLNAWPLVVAGVALLVVGKIAVVVAVGAPFGLSLAQAMRAGAYLGPGGEFAFVALGDAVTHSVLAAPTVQLLFCVTALSMAVTPYLASGAAFVAEWIKERQALADPDAGPGALAPAADGSEAADLSGHVILCGFGRIGQVVATMLQERLIPFVALDTDPARVAAGRRKDLPVYYGDAGSPGVLHAIGAGRAACAVVALDSPSSNYRVVFQLGKEFPGVASFCRARDVENGLALERAGATAVIPEMLEPSLQLASAVLMRLAVPADEAAAAVDAFRREHVRELALANPLLGDAGGSLVRVDSDDDDDATTLVSAIPALG